MTQGLQATIKQVDEDSPLKRVRNAVVTVIVAAAVVASCSSSSLAPSEPEAQRSHDVVGSRVLFIGNSLTEANGLPAMVETLSRQGGGTPISTASVVFGGFSLEDHWNQGMAQRRIAEGGWSIVVLQQGPSALPESQVALREWTARFDSVIRASGARTALYMVWPESNRPDAFDAVSRSYARAAEDVTGMLLPVGEAWRAAWRRDPEAPCTGRTGFIRRPPPPTWRRSSSTSRSAVGHRWAFPHGRRCQRPVRSSCRKPHRKRTRNSVDADHADSSGTSRRYHPATPQIRPQSGSGHSASRSKRDTKTG